MALSLFSYWSSAKIPRIIMKKALKSFLQENKKTVLTLFIVGIVGEIFLRLTSSDLLTFSALLLYILFIKLYKLKSSLTFLLCLVLLLVVSIDYVFTGASVSTEKAAVWFVLFFTVGVIQQWKE